VSHAVLLTAFEPFGGAADNPSMSVVARVAAAWTRPERLHSEVLPVAYERADRRLVELLEEIEPAVVVGVGLAAGRARPSLERLAVNLRDAAIPDNDGAQPVDAPVIPGGPLAVPTSLPVRASVIRLQAAGHDVELSMTAGTFVCNAVFYRVATWANLRPARRAGFVHVPLDRLEDSVAAVRTVIEDALEQEADVAVAMGASE
jgi:pyroglutamyl-peptidase